MKGKSVSKTLEEMAESIIDMPSANGLGVGNMIRQDIALSLDHLGRHRTLHRKQLCSLLKAECYIGTELKEVYQRTPLRSLHPLPDRDRLRKRLLKNEQERRKCSVSYEEGIQTFHKKLLELVQKWERVGKV